MTYLFGIIFGSTDIPELNDKIRSIHVKDNDSIVDEHLFTLEESLTLDTQEKAIALYEEKYKKDITTL
jgi:hypothetical protein